MPDVVVCADSGDNVEWLTRGNSLKEPASKAYEQVFAPHHGWTIRKAVGAGMFMLPTKTQFLKKLNEQGSTILSTSSVSGM